MFSIKSGYLYHIGILALLTTLALLLFLSVQPFIAALSLGEKCARAEVCSAVHFHIGYGDVIAFLDAADNLMYATVVAPKVGQLFISKEERVRHFVLFLCFGN